MTTTAPARSSDRLLRGVLAADAVVGLLTAIGMLAATAMYANLTGLPESLLRAAAVVLLGYVVALTTAALLRPLRRALVVGIIAANGAWVVASALVAVLVSLTVAGLVYVLGQALVVVGFGVAEYLALRRVRD